MDDSTPSLFAWMAWTPPVAVFFSTIALMLLVMTAWEWRSPTVARRGLLPLVTTRGDRLFIGLLVLAWTVLAWIGLSDWDLRGGLLTGLLALVAILRWG